MTMTPTITAFSGTPYRSDTFRIIGTGFGRVTSVAFVDSSLNQYEMPFQVDTGESIHVTIPKTMPNGTYNVVIGNLDNTPSVNQAGTVVVPDDPTLNTTPVGSVPTEVIPDPASAAALAIMQRLRMELGDYSSSFRDVVVGDGATSRFELSVDVIDDSSTGGLAVSVFPAADGSPPVTLTVNTDFTLDAQAGTIVLNSPLQNGYRLVVDGAHFQFFDDDDLLLFVRSAALKHTHNSEALQVYRDLDNFKHYLYTNTTVDTVAPVEYHPIALLAAVEALNVIQVDAAYDIDVTTAEGTSLPRGERYRNIGQLVAQKQATYDGLCLMLGVGLGKVECFTVRRISRTTGRLVPVYLSREYDDVITPPIRNYAPRNVGVTGEGFVAPDPYSYGGTGVGGYP